jgi:hypothetical protein
MAALVWGAWGAEWAQNKKVAFNGLARTITVNSDVTALNLQTDVWSRWVDWAALPGNDYHTLAMRRTGYDTIPGGRSGLIYFLQNGWKLIIDMNKVRVTGVLYSDDFETAYWAADGQPIYPATVSAHPGSDRGRGVERRAAQPDRKPRPGAGTDCCRRCGRAAGRSAPGQHGAGQGSGAERHR